MENTQIRLNVYHAFAYPTLNEHHLSNTKHTNTHEAFPVLSCEEEGDNRRAERTRLERVHEVEARSRSFVRPVLLWLDNKTVTYRRVRGKVFGSSRRVLHSVDGTNPGFAPLRVSPENHLSDRVEANNI